VLEDDGAAVVGVTTETFNAAVVIDAVGEMMWCPKAAAKASYTAMSLACMANKRSVSTLVAM
jgi:hypothetical protein